ncbi:MAG: hypothetical protein IPI35_16540 [Deltaproteobacteria bacterium]|nr:hypothetical protein [Deltaproteobacteria bacterium]
MLSTLPGVFISRPFTFAALHTPPAPGAKKLLLLLGDERGRRELDAVKALWVAKGHQVTVLEIRRRGDAGHALFSEVWDVVHFITHGDREKVFLGVPAGFSTGRHSTPTENASATSCKDTSLTTCLLSVCNGGLRTFDVGERPGALLWRGVAQHIIGAGVPNVIGWSNLAYIDDCRRATPVWHQAYLNGEDPRAATQKARRVLVGVKGAPTAGSSTSPPTRRPGLTDHPLRVDPPLDTLSRMTSSLSGSSHTIDVDAAALGARLQTVSATPGTST